MATLNLDLVEACPLCGNVEDFKMLVDAGEAGKLVKCVCGLRFAKERIKVEILAGSQQFYIPSCFAPGKKEAFVPRNIQAVDDLIKIEKHTGHFAGDKRLFDVGCGSGIFMQAAKARGWVVAGNDLSYACAVLIWHLFKILIAVAELPAMVFPKKRYIHVATLCNSVEHLRNPVNELKHLHDHMVGRGVIFIRTPEYTDEQLKEKHQLPFHFFDYDKFTLNRLLRDTGFEVLEYERIDDPPTMLVIGRKK